MLGLPLPGAKGEIQRVLVLGAHSDDIEIGCGATMLALTRARPELEITWVVLGAEGEREREARESAKTFLASAVRSEVTIYGFRNSYFPYVGEKVKDVFEELKAQPDPDVIFTHTRHDLHQDHRIVCELTWNTWRDHLDPGIRGPEVRRRPRRSERVRTRVGGARPRESRADLQPVRKSTRQALVRRRRVPRADAHTRHGGASSEWVRRSVHVPQVDVVDGMTSRATRRGRARRATQAPW